MSLKILDAHPTVCAVEDYYIIAVPVRKNVLMRIEIGGHTFYNHANGVKISDTRVQMFKVPSDILNENKKYTVVFRQVFLRFSSRCTTGKENSVTYSFRPVEKDTDINICHISDTHGRRNSPVKAGRFFSHNLDLLILNGDISDSCSFESRVILNYKIASDITGGQIPVIISRGNHDLRGKKAERLSSLLPSAEGKFYYTVTVGNMWFLLLDCGEDKVDAHREYSGTAAFHPFRVEETEFLREAVKKGTALSEKIKYRFIVSHVPFPIRNMDIYCGEQPFDIENEIYDNWCGIINTHIKPDLFISGHMHETELVRRESERNSRKICCDILIGSEPTDKDGFTAANITLAQNGCTVIFNDENLNIKKRCSSDFV